MTIGKKKKYSAPQLTSVTVDRQITMVMNTATPPDLPPDPAPAMMEPSPFGGKEPDYSTMKK